MLPSAVIIAFGASDVIGLHFEGVDPIKAEIDRDWSA